MALIKCTECGKEFSDRASACPNCGCPTHIILETLEENEWKKEECFKNILVDQKHDSNKNTKLFCDICGHELPPDSDFCQYCGNKISNSWDEKTTREQIKSPHIIKETSNQEHITKNKPKKKKIVILVVCGIVAALIIAALLIYLNKKAEFNRQPRNMATEAMDKKYNNVYANVILIEPMYYTSTYNTISSGTTLGEGDLKEIVCKCKTKEGPYIWVVFYYEDYPGGTGSKNPKEYQKLLYGYQNPKHITGSIKTSQAINEELYDEIGDVFVLYYEK